MTFKEKYEKSRDEYIISLYEKYKKEEPEASRSRLCTRISIPSGYAPAYVNRMLNRLIPTNNA